MSGIQLLLLLSVFLLHLRCLLLMLLLHLLITLLQLLSARGVGLLLSGLLLLLRHFLMVLLLLLRQLLMVLLLLLCQLLLLLLIFLIQLRVSGVRRWRSRMRRNLLGVSRRSSGSCVALGSCARLVRSCARLVGGGVLGRGTVRRRMIRRACLRSCYHSALVKGSRLWSCSDGRPALVYRSSKLWIPASRLHLLILSRDGWNVPGMHRGFFRRRRPSFNSTIAAVVADPVHGDVVHRRVVNIVNVGDVDVVNGAVVVKLTVVPAPTFIAVAEVTVSVNNTAVKSNLGSPVARVEGVAGEHLTESSNL